MLHAADAQDRLNDFVIKLANVNGTGSASANTLLMKSIFRMGIPVIGKNYFPSNIQGLPTWYEIRVSRDGYVARSGRVDIMVAMNAETYAKDVKDVSPGGYLVYDSTWPRPALLKRDDITIFGAPFARMCNETFQGVRSRILLKNIMYAGFLGALLDIEMDIMRAMLGESYASKKSLLDANVKALEIGYNYAKEHCQCPLPLRVARMDKTSNQIMIDGNTAAALGCLYAGATVGAWYPITPSTSLMDSFKSFCQKWRVDPQTGERKRRWHSFAGSKRQAQVECARLLTEINTGTSVDPSRITVDAFLERWLANPLFATLPPGASGLDSVVVWPPKGG